LSLCVLDASVAVELSLPASRAGFPRVLSAIAQDGCLVPAIWWWEVLNVLLRAERRPGGLSRHTDSAWSLWGAMRIMTDLDDAPSPEALLPLARAERLRLFDAAYLELAERTGLPLATLDQSLAAAAVRRGVELLALTP
jgi:predicted nucleic acid-binding protein